MSSTSAEFCDTNVLVYAHDRSAAEKQQRAIVLLERLRRDQSAALSIQVLQEFYVTVTRRLARPLSPETAREIVADLAHLHVVEPTTDDVLHAIDSAQHWQISLWDAMLLTTANKAGAAVLWSEDLNNGQQYGAVTVRNPFVEPS